MRATWMIRAVLVAQFIWLVSYEIQMARGMQTEGWFHGLRAWNAVVGSGVALMLLRAICERGRIRWGWLLLAVGSILWILGDNYFTLVVQESENTAVITWSDIGYLAFVPVAVLGMLCLAWVPRGQLSPALVLDGAAAAAAISAMSSGLVMRDVLTAYSGDRFDVIVNAAYPVSDAVLIGLVVAAWAMRQWRLDAQWMWLGAGLLVFWLADSIFLVESARDAYTSPNVIDPGWAACFVFMGVAATRRSGGASKAQEWAQTFWPTAFALLALGTLIASAVLRLHPTGVILAGISALCVLLRLFVTLRANNAILAASVQEATTDHLTGLGNRRALFKALQEAVEAGQEVSLGLYDLDGFKAYNDRFGHPAGDALLARCGHALQGGLGDRGSAYRLGGDEFCVLSRDGHRLLTVAAQCLSEVDRGVQIGASYGAVQLPQEAQSATEAMRLADERMYSRKAAARRSVATISAEVIVQLLAATRPDVARAGQATAALVAAVAARCGWSAQVVERVRLAALLRESGVLAATGPSDLAQNTRRVVAAVSGLEPLVPLVALTHGQNHVKDDVDPEALQHAQLIVLCDALVRRLPNWNVAPLQARKLALAEVDALDTADPVLMARLRERVLSGITMPLQASGMYAPAPVS